MRVWAPLPQLTRHTAVAFRGAHTCGVPNIRKVVCTVLQQGRHQKLQRTYMLRIIDVEQPGGLHGNEHVLGCVEELRVDFPPDCCADALGGEVRCGQDTGLVLESEDGLGKVCESQRRYGAQSARGDSTEVPYGAGTAR